MTLTAAPYALTLDTLPSSVFDWQLDLSRAALLIHDMQHYFIRAYSPHIEPRRTLLGHVRALRDLAHRQDMPVVYTAQPGDMSPRERGLLFDVWGRGMSAEETDRGITPEVAPGPRDVVLTKWRYSAFFRSDLLARLHDAGRSQLIVCGVYAEVGITATVLDAFARDIEPFVVADAVADFDPSAHERALGYVARTCARVVRAREVLTKEQGDD